MNAADDGFLARWSRRKALARDAVADPGPAAAPTAAPPVAAPPVPIPAAAPPAAQEPAQEQPAPPPTLDEVESLTPGSDFTRFVAREVDPAVRNAALKKLFADPRFNLMDGLDVYIDDYGRPDPLPEGMLRRMAQATALGLFRDEPAPAGVPASAAPREAADEDTDLRLQSHDAAGRGPAPQPEPGAGEDAGRES